MNRSLVPGAAVFKPSLDTGHASDISAGSQPWYRRKSCYGYRGHLLQSERLVQDHQCLHHSSRCPIPTIYRFKPPRIIYLKPASLPNTLANCAPRAVCRFYSPLSQTLSTTSSTPAQGQDYRPVYPSLQSVVQSSSDTDMEMDVDSRNYRETSEATVSSGTTDYLSPSAGETDSSRAGTDGSMGI